MEDFPGLSFVRCLVSREFQSELAFLGPKGCSDAFLSNESR